MKNKLIQFENTTKTFRRQQVLRQINLDIHAGDRVALVGSNGAGKTTLIRCLLGEYVCTGKVLIDGMNPRNYRRQVLGRIGFVPQSPPPVKIPTGQLVNFAAGVCGTDVHQIHEICNQMGLDIQSLKNQAFNKLSGGQKQKILISIALGRECDILVLDEPAANLDPEARHKFFELLAERQDGAAMLISSHRLDEVAAMVNRVVELDQGKIVLDDQVADQVDMASVMDCRISLTRSNPAFANTVREWGFLDSGDGENWTGQLAGADRLRFLGVLSRYAGLLNGIHLEESNNNPPAKPEVFGRESLEGACDR